MRAPSATTANILFQWHGQFLSVYVCRLWHSTVSLAAGSAACSGSMLGHIVGSVLMLIAHCITALESSWCSVIELAQARQLLPQPLPRWLSRLVLLSSSILITMSAVILRICYGSSQGKRVHTNVSFTALFVCFARALGNELGLCPDPIAKQFYPWLPFGVVAHLQVSPHLRVCGRPNNRRNFRSIKRCTISDWTMSSSLPSCNCQACQTSSSLT